MTSGSAPRRGLVLGAGDVLGFARAVGALTALEQERGVGARAADVLVGASSGPAARAPRGGLRTRRPGSSRWERRFRGLVTKRLEREAEKVRRGGTEVTVLSPGPEDLVAIGENLMDHRRRERVLRTSLRTSAVALRRAADAGLACVG